MILLENRLHLYQKCDCIFTKNVSTKRTTYWSI